MTNAKANDKAATVAESCAPRDGRGVTEPSMRYLKRNPSNTH
jgi:hypothetical protein